jgi:hypothetical protein
MGDYKTGDLMTVHMYSTLEMVELSDVWEELPDSVTHTHTKNQKQNVSNLYHFDMALYPEL